MAAACEKMAHQSSTLAHPVIVRSLQSKPIRWNPYFEGQEIFACEGNISYIMEIE